MNRIIFNLVVGGGVVTYLAAVLDPRTLIRAGFGCVQRFRMRCVAVQKTRKGRAVRWQALPLRDAFRTVQQHSSNGCDSDKCQQE
jgi:hypothetical protein